MFKLIDFNFQYKEYKRYEDERIYSKRYTCSKM